MKVKIGTVGYGSTRGYYNFFYPDVGKECVFKIDCIVEHSGWLDYNNLVPVKVPKYAVKGQAFVHNEHAVVWISREDIVKN